MRCNHRRHNHFTPESYGYDDLHPAMKMERIVVVVMFTDVTPYDTDQYTQAIAQSRGMCSVCQRHAFDVAADDSMDKIHDMRIIFDQNAFSCMRRRKTRIFSIFFL